MALIFFYFCQQTVFHKMQHILFLLISELFSCDLKEHVIKCGEFGEHPAKGDFPVLQIVQYVRTRLCCAPRTAHSTVSVCPL